MTAPNSCAAPARIWSRDFILIILVNAFMFTGFQMLPTALPPYLKSLGAADGILGMLSGISMVATLLMRPLSGNLLDTLGRRSVFLCGLFIMVFSTTAFYFFPVVGIILAVRFVHGMGWGISSTSCSTIAADCVPKSRFGEGMGYFGLSASLGMAVAPALALSMPAGPMIWISTGFSAAALGIAFVLNCKPVEKAARTPGKRPSIYEKACLLPSAVIMLSTMCYGAIITFIALYAKSRGVTHNIGWFFTVYASVMLLTRPFIGKLVDRKGSGVVVIPSLVFNITAVALLGLADSFISFMGCAAIYGIGQGSLFSSTQTMAVLSAPKGRIGAANSTFFTGFDLGLGCGAMLSGYLAAILGYSGMFVSFTIFPAVGIAVYIIWRKHAHTGPVAQEQD